MSRKVPRELVIFALIAVAGYLLSAAVQRCSPAPAPASRTIIEGR